VVVFSMSIVEFAPRVAHMSPRNARGVGTSCCVVRGDGPIMPRGATLERPAVGDWLPDRR
jgi:hypothetical protein